jgi:hypothetical protein
MYIIRMIPGPRKPLKSQINDFTALLVNDLLQFWHPGVFFTSTAKFPSGQLVQCALVPLICDAIGARSSAGFHSITSQFVCTYCKLEKSDLKNFDCATWPSHHILAHHATAEAWKNAMSPADKLAIEEKHGVYWSELLHLLYWNPILFTVIDTMHNLYLGLFENHCHDIWGMDVTVEDGDGQNSPTGPKYPSPTLPKVQQA